MAKGRVVAVLVAQELKSGMGKRQRENKRKWKVEAWVEALGMMVVLMNSSVNEK